MIKRLSQTAAWLGVMLAIGGLLALGINPGWRLYVTLAETAALLLLIFFFAVHFEAVKGFSTRRSTKLGLNSILMVVIFLSIVGILNFLSSRHSQRLDLSETQRFTLAPQTQKILKELRRGVKITAFTQAKTQSEVQIKDLLETYSHQTQQISYDIIDPAKKPAIAKQYGITQYDTLVLESGQQETQVKNLTEQELTNAVIRVSKDEKRKILFLQGHGEHSLTDMERTGYSKVKEALEKQGYHVEGLSLLQAGTLPDKTSVLVIAGPQKPVLPQEKAALAAYLGSKGKILALLDPQTETNLEDILAEWGIHLGPGIIVDTLSRLFGGDLTIPIVTSYPSHEITREFDLATFFPLAQMVRFESSNSGLEFHPLAETTENSWSKAELQRSNVSFNPQKDIRGPLTLAGIVTRKGAVTTPQKSFQENDPQEEAPDNPEDRSTLVVFGDSDFAANDSYNFSGNGDLLLNTINYLAQEKGLIAITPKERNFAPLFLSRTQAKVVMYISLIVMPAVVFMTGLGIWRRRRRL